MTIKVLLSIAILDTILLIFAVFHFWMGKKIRGYAIPIIKTGIAPKGSGFFGHPPNDVKVPRWIGYLGLYYGATYGYLAGWILLLMMPVLSVLLIYIDLFIVISN